VRKPRKDFPLFPHASGRWCKKVRGKFVYFGKVESDPQGRAALELWLAQRDDLLAGRTPRLAGDGLTIRDLINRFLTVKKQAVESKEITQRHFDQLYRVCELVIDQFGKNRLVEDLAAEDFEALRASLAKTRAAWALGGVIAKVRSVFKYGYEAALIEKPMRFGPGFKRPAKAALRRERDGRPPKLFTSAQIRALIDEAGVQLRAMIMLGVNCGLGNTDCGQLRFEHLDVKAGWLNYPRPKTGVDRRCSLWPETIKAIKAAVEQRPEPREEANRSLVFVTKYGSAWAKDKEGSASLGHEFTKLLTSLELRQPGFGFYTLRHSFRTVADATRDFPAIDLIMGHSDNSMASHYREGIDDERLKAVTDHVHAWLWPKALRRKPR
jgi:integrase